MGHPLPIPQLQKIRLFLHFPHRDLVLAALPNLLQLDSQPVHENTAEESAGGGSCSSEEEEEEQKAPFTFDRGARVRTGHGALSVSAPHLESLPFPGRFPDGAAPGADGEGAGEEEEGPGRAPDPAAGAVGAPGSAAGAGRGQSHRHGHTGVVSAPPERDTAPKGTAGTSGGIQRVPASCWHHAAPRRGSEEGERCQRSREWAVIPNILQQQPGIKCLFPPQSHPEGLETGESTHRAVGSDPNPISLIAHPAHLLVVNCGLAPMEGVRKSQSRTLGMFFGSSSMRNGVGEAEPTHLCGV